MKNRWGFLRETTEKAKKSGLDKDANLHRTGLDEYLKVIFPDVNDWIHNKSLGKMNVVNTRSRPDYRSEMLKLIIEFDGLRHYSEPHVIENDIRLTALYKDLGYTVVRIPFFIQLSNRAVKTLFDVIINEPLFDVKIPSFGILSKNTPGYLCPAGIERMAKEFKLFPDQYEINMNYLKQQNKPLLTGIDYLRNEYEKINTI